MGWALATISFDLRRTVALSLLIVAGCGLNLVGLLKRTLTVRVWLRLLAVLVGLAILVAILAIRRSTLETLGTLSPDNLAPREHLSQVVRGASWLAAGMVYVLVSVVALPAADAGARSGQR